MKVLFNKINKMIIIQNKKNSKNKKNRKKIIKINLNKLKKPLNLKQIKFKNKLKKYKRL